MTDLKEVTMLDRGWPSHESYSVLKEKRTSELREDYLQEFSNIEEFKNLSHEQTIIASKLMASFQFGVEMVDKKLGVVDITDSINIIFNKRSHRKSLDEIDISYRPDRDAYIVGIEWFTKTVEETSKDKDFNFDSLGGIEGAIDPYDGLEIAGVEEAAHRLYKHVKKPTDMNTSNLPPDEYWASDIERRALLWKLGYTERYFPQYHESLQTTKTYSDINRAVFKFQSDNNTK